MLLKIFLIFSNLEALISSKTPKALHLVIMIKAKKANFLQVHITPLHHMSWLSHQINHSLPSFRCVGCYIIAIFLHIWCFCYWCLKRWPVSPKNLKVRWTSVIKSTNKTFCIKNKKFVELFFEVSPRPIKTVCVFFLWFKLKYSLIDKLIFSSITLLILPSSFSTGSINFIYGLPETSLWPFNVKKQSFPLLISTQLKMSLIFENLVPCILILFLKLFFAFLYVSITALLKSGLFSSLTQRCKLNVLLTNARVLLDCLTALILLFSFVRDWFLSLKNLIIFGIPIK